MSNDDPAATQVHVFSVGELSAALASAGLLKEIPVVVLVGGAAGMAADAADAVATVLHATIVPIIERHGAAVVDGGTDSGVMRLIGQARTAAGSRFPLIGVAAEHTVIVPGSAPPRSDAAALEPHHSLFVLVPGTDWGDESPWISEVATALASGRPSVTVLINGGLIAYNDVQHSLDADRPVVVLAGTGRTADAIAQARLGAMGDQRATMIAASPLTVIVDVGSPTEVAAAVEMAFVEPEKTNAV